MKKIISVLSAYYSSFIDTRGQFLYYGRLINLLLDYVRCLHRYISVGREK